VAKTATKQLLAPLQKHSLGSCTVDSSVPPSNGHRRGTYRFATRYSVILICMRIGP